MAINSVLAWITTMSTGGSHPTEKELEDAPATTEKSTVPSYGAPNP